MRWSDKIEAISSAYRADGRTLPDELIEPELLPGAGRIFEAWGELSHDRSSGFEVGMIPFLSIDAYGRRYGFISEFDLLRRAIRAMEVTFARYHQEQIDAEKSRARATRSR